MKCTCPEIEVKYYKIYILISMFLIFEFTLGKLITLKPLSNQRFFGIKRD